MRTSSLLLTAAVLMAPLGVVAQPVSGLYVGAGAGADLLQERNLATKPGHVLLQSDYGFMGVASVGYGLGNGLRTEIEGNYRTNHIHALRGLGVPTAAGGSERAYGAMANVLYDFDSSFYGFNPYVGVGVGWEQSAFSSAHAYNSSFRINSTGVVNAAAYQGIVGVSHPIEAVPGLSVTAEYRVHGILPIDGSYRGQVFSGQTVGGVKLRADEDLAHSLMVGLRYQFDTPAAPAPIVAPVRAAQAVAVRTYLVFFDWDRADLTARARSIIAEAAKATSAGVTRIEVSGHADSSGNAHYNQNLSMRRAQNVRTELVRLGVPAESITTQGFGATKPLVATAPGVREPQNRRVEIVLQ